MTSRFHQQSTDTLDSFLDKIGLDLEEGIPAAGGDELRFNCPFCVKKGQPREDKKKRLYVHVTSGDRYGFYNCFNCGAKGRFNPSTIPAKYTVVKKEEPPDIVALPEDYYPAIPGMSAYEYLIGRGISPKDIDYYKLGISRGRIIFPDYDKDGKLDYWVGRSYIGQEPKYYNCKLKQGRASKIYNLGRILSAGLLSITVVEGPMSAIVAGHDAVATYGKGVTKEQIKRLSELKLDNMYIALDPDAREKSLDLARALCSFYEIRLVPIPKGHDPCSLGYEGFQAVKEKWMGFSPHSNGCRVRFMLV